MPDKEYTHHTETIRNWLLTTAEHMTRDPHKREWCIFGITASFTPENLNDFFSTKKINEDYEIEKNMDRITNIPIAQLQIENDHIFALNRMMASRHQNRLKHYRDDLEQKGIRTPSSLAISLAKLHLLKENMEG
jgi:hypothetical protein